MANGNKPKRGQPDLTGIPDIPTVPDVTLPRTGTGLGADFGANLAGQGIRGTNVNIGGPAQQGLQAGGLDQTPQGPMPIFNQAGSLASRMAQGTLGQAGQAVQSIGGVPTQAPLDPRVGQIAGMTADVRKAFAPQLFANDPTAQGAQYPQTGYYVAGGYGGYPGHTPAYLPQKDIAAHGATGMPGPGAPPGVQAAGDDVARRLLSPSGIPEGLRKNFMNRATALMGMDPNYMGQKRFDLSMEKIMGMMRENPNLGKSGGTATITPHSRSAGPSITAERTKAPIDVISALGDLQSTMFAQGDIVGAQTAGQIADLMAADVAAESRVLAQEVAGQHKGTADDMGQKGILDAVKQYNKGILTIPGFERNQQFEQLAAMYGMPVIPAADAAAAMTKADRKKKEQRQNL